jgi:hypothetical protein
LARPWRQGAKHREDEGHRIWQLERDGVAVPDTARSEGLRYTRGPPGEIAPAQHLAASHADCDNIGMLDGELVEALQPAAQANGIGHRCLPVPALPDRVLSLRFHAEW